MDYKKILLPLVLLVLLTVAVSTVSAADVADNSTVSLADSSSNSAINDVSVYQQTSSQDSALQAKYPELMSFKAMEDSNPLNTARIDCDGNSTRIVVQYDGETYFVTPFMFNKKIYYACYSKNDPNFIKQSFE